MSKLCILALLLYNLVITNCNPLDDELNSYRERAEEAKLDLLKLFKAFKENRRDVTESSLENWTGRWMPDRPGDPTPPPKVWPATPFLHQQLHRVSMGSSISCDDGKSNLSVDWDNSPVNYTCYGPKIIPSLDTTPLSYSETIPYAYTAEHKCMNESIKYQDAVPLYTQVLSIKKKGKPLNLRKFIKEVGALHTSQINAKFLKAGTHRPVWPVYGEYKFLPRERWLHSLEHGAVVMLYHPCANPLEVQRLKSLVTDCLRRHIISPYNLVDEDRPLVLVTWGSRLSMSYVNTEIVRNFIRTKAKRGAEPIPSDGTFDEGLLSKSRTVSDFDDTILCPTV